MAIGISFENIYKSFGEREVLRGVSFSVEHGEIVALLGPNGSGKSTLFKMTIGVLTPDHGRVLVNNIDPSEDPIEARKIVGYIPEDPLLFESLKASEFVEFVLSVYGVSPPPDTVSKVVKVLDLKNEMGKLVGELSRGNRRRLMLATLMLRDPDVLVLDEVFSGLDPMGARIIKAWLREKASRGATILFSTHVLPVAEAVADRVVIIHRGRIVAEGQPGELTKLFGAKELEDVYLEVTGYSREYEEIIRSLRGGSET